MPCSWGACYSNPTAITAGVAINLGDSQKLLVYVGGYWKQQSNLTQLVVKNMNIYHTDTVIVNYAVGKSAQGLYYDGCQGGRLYNGAPAPYCSSIGMRLPSTGEVDAWIAGGVPPCPGAPSTWCSPGGGSYWVWGPTASGSAYYNWQTRCVK